MGTLKCLTTGHDFDPVSGVCRRLGCKKRRQKETDDANVSQGSLADYDGWIAGLSRYGDTRDDADRRGTGEATSHVGTDDGPAGYSSPADTGSGGGGSGGDTGSGPGGNSGRQ